MSRSLSRRPRRLSAYSSAYLGRECTPDLLAEAQLELSKGGKPIETEAELFGRKKTGLVALRGAEYSRS